MVQEPKIPDFEIAENQSEKEDMYMNKKEVLEIRKTFTPENCNITKMRGCYVDSEKNIKLELTEALLSLPEEEGFKYFDMFKHTLSGSIGKNLLNMEFPLDQEMPDGTQAFLMKLRNSQLEDDLLVEEFYQKVIDHYVYPENYYIVLIYGNYDIPGRSKSGDEMFDASDEVYTYIMCSICPVKLTKPGLCYNGEKNTIEERMRDRLVEHPAKGFLFPLFNDRSTDIHGLLYYTKNPDELQEDFIDQVLGCGLPLSAEYQKETFHSLLSETLGEECDYEVVKTIHENLSEMIESVKDEPEPLTLDKYSVKTLLENSGVPEEKMEHFDDNFAETAGEKTTLLATNIVNTRSFQVQTPDVVIKVNPERTDLVETRIIDGRQCLVIAVDDHIEVNGLNVRTIAQNL